MKLYKYGNVIYHPVASREVTRYGEEAPYVLWSMYPIAVYDYVNPDVNDTQGWVQELTGLKSVDMLSILQYIKSESLSDCLSEEGYEEVEIRSIYYQGWNQNEDMIVSTIDAEEAVENSLDVL